MLKMLTTKIKMMALCIAVLCAAATAMLAQSTTQGAISGTVFDATDAVVANAKVTIHSDATNADVTVNSGDSGEFRAPLLPPGTYSVTIVANGFREQRSTGVVVQVNQVTEINPHLTTGSATQTVEVGANIDFDALVSESAPLEKSRSGIS